MNEGITTKLIQLSSRLEELNCLLSSENITSDLDYYRKLTREHAEIVPVVELYHAYQLSEHDIQAAQEMTTDAEMREFADAEIRSGKEKLTQIELALQKLLIPRDPNDEYNIFLEIRAGTGGDESALFAGDLFRMYARFAERQHWQIEIISQSLSEVGGYTSACTVAVMPEADEISDIVLNPSELRIDTYRASGAGGQHINKTDSAVRITHIPTGIVVECQDGRSQHKNKAQAMSVLVARIRDKQMREQQAKQAATRKLLIGSGDRSERIRTYNFPQGRISDHRINLTLYKIDQIMDGDLDELCSSLASEHQAEQLAAMGE
jgi:peptide chain release factor 1